MKKVCSDADKESKTINQQIEEIGKWMLHNTRHPDFLKKVSERNALLVKLESKRQQRTNSWWKDPLTTVKLPIVTI